MRAMRARRRLAVVLAASVLGVVAGCGSGSSGGASGGTTTLNVGIVGIAPDASMYLGIKKGFFAAEKLKVVPRISGGGAAVIPGVVSGDLQLGSSNPVSLILAADKGLPIRVIAGQNEAAASVHDRRHIISGVLVPKDSPIRSARDLAGKTIAVNTLENIGDVTIKAALARRGVPVDGIKFTEVGFPDMLAALEAHRVDAAWELEPFLGQGRKEGDRMVMANFVEAAPRLPLTAYFTTKAYADDHPDVVARFRRAMGRSSRYAARHPAAVRQIVTTFAKIPPEAARAMALPVFTTRISSGALDTLAGSMQRFGLVDHRPDLSALVATG